MKSNENKRLQAFGWNTNWDTVLAEQPQDIRQLSPARVIAQFSHAYKLITEYGEHSASVTGKFEFNAVKKGDFPAVGDWVMVEMLPGECRSVIHAVLPRRSASRAIPAGQRRAYHGYSGDARASVMGC